MGRCGKGVELAKRMTVTIWLHLFFLSRKTMHILVFFNAKVGLSLYWPHIGHMLSWFAGQKTRLRPIKGSNLGFRWISLSKVVDIFVHIPAECIIIYLYPVSQSLLSLYFLFLSTLLGNPILDTKIFVFRPDFVRHAQGTPPWILQQDGLESSGRRLISPIGKTKRITFFLAFFLLHILWKKCNFFLDFFRLFSQDWAGLDSSGWIKYP